MSTSRYREILGVWLERPIDIRCYSNSGRGSGWPAAGARFERIEAACWTLFEIGFRTDDVVAALWSVAEREPGEVGDASLATLVALGEGLRDRTRLLDAVHGRARLRQSNGLIGAIKGLGDPASLDLIKELWLADVSSSSWRRHSFLIVRILSSIANANPDRPEVQDRTWNILSELHRIEPDRMESELALVVTWQPSATVRAWSLPY